MTDVRTVVLASGNEGKLRELERLLAEPRLQLVTMKSLVPPGFEVDETGATFAENAWLKALAVADVTGLPALADDSGLVVDALGGRPGVYSARYAGLGASDAANNELLLRELTGVPADRRGARFVAVLALATPGADGARRVAEAQGVLEGRVVEAPRGTQGFGYDVVFEATERPGRTTAELSLDEKNEISHRARAARSLAPALSAFLSAR
ncbi:MAG TPA: RdgB/HAM1 family non-canonical purine NTP pyrophosphatase [Polyangiaceae bacterium]|nr:RdgB/HAM1 family non-canonical purine NTP pyrophosphatase [Polyangiaceae bacterium]